MPEIQQVPFKMDRAEFDYFRTKIFSLAGISLSDAKLDLLQARLRSRVIALGMSSFEEYRFHLESISQTDEEWETFINLLTTNKTDWFREPKHFDYIVNDFLPKWLALGKKKLSVWCAACSTGEEAYTLSLILNEALKGTDIKYTILASDIDTKVLRIAKNGVYPRDLIHQIPERFHRMGFCFGTKEISNWMKVRKEIKEPIQFKQLNLTVKPFNLDEGHDLILCRNVMIYFNPTTVKNVVDEIYRVSNKDSVLIIAHSESLQNIQTSWRYRSPSIYYKGKIF